MNFIYFTVPFIFDDFIFSGVYYFFLETCVFYNAKDCYYFIPTILYFSILFILLSNQNLMYIYYLYIFISTEA